MKTRNRCPGLGRWLLAGLFVLTVAGTDVGAANRTIGLFINEPGAFDGYTLFAPLSYTDTYLINNEGNLVHSWTSTHLPYYAAYLLPNGNLLRAAEGGRVQEFDWDGNLVWDFVYADSTHLRHHDIQAMPNGNVLVVAWEYKTQTQAIAAGRNPSILREVGLWPEQVAEVKPTGDTTGEIVWEWHVWDHLIQDYDSTRENYGEIGTIGVGPTHPELIDINYVPTILSRPEAADWNHINGIDYNPRLDQILLSVHRFSEIWVIDHSTTTLQAASHVGGRYGKGGDLLYRWGNPAAYRAGGVQDQVFFRQHDARWVDSLCPGAGNITVFNNGVGRGYSSADEITPPLAEDGSYLLAPHSAYAPESLAWSYQADPPSDFYSEALSGAQQLPNGNTLICHGVSGIFLEVTPAGEIVWKYINPVGPDGPMDQGDGPPMGGVGGQQVNAVFQVTRYAPDYPGLAGRDLTPRGPIEHYPSAVDESGPKLPAPRLFLSGRPNPFRGAAAIDYTLPVSGPVRLTVYDAAGREVRTLVRAGEAAGAHRVTWDGRDDTGTSVPAGIYFGRLFAAGQSATCRLTRAR